MLATPPAASSVGIYTTALATAPPDYGGYFEVTQTDNYWTETWTNLTQPGTITDTSNGNPYRDGCTISRVNPIDLSLGSYSTASSGGTVNYQTVDAPVDGLDSSSYVQEQVQNAFVDYFMFFPNASNGIWVPIAHFMWTYNGTATYQNSVWALTAAPSPNPATILASTFSASSPPQFPTWTQPRPISTACPGPPKGADIVKRATVK